MTGLSKLVARITQLTEKEKANVVEVVEKNAVRVKNHAKADHFKGKSHAIGRYDNQTSNLTNSITASHAKESKGIVEAVVSTNKEYAPKVEFGTATTAAYPFMQPAITAIEPDFLRDLRALKL